MILYKYTDLNTANLILENFTLKFSRASSLNDPFELGGLYYNNGPHDIRQDQRHMSASNLYGILSLTRNPLNPLMWAHYGKGNNSNHIHYSNLSHAGLVFGIDVNEAQLNCPKVNVLPAKYGSIIYTSTRPQHPFSDSDNYVISQSKLQFNPNNLERLQRIFLYKSSDWSYEEEVRIVRSLVFGNTNEIQPFKKSCFKEVYIGVRYLDNINTLITLSERIKKALPDCMIYVCDYDKTEWTFKKKTLTQALESFIPE